MLAHDMHDVDHWWPPHVNTSAETFYNAAFSSFMGAFFQAFGFLVALAIIWFVVRAFQRWR